MADIRNCESSDEQVGEAPAVKVYWGWGTVRGVIPIAQQREAEDWEHQTLYLYY